MSTGPTAVRFPNRADHFLWLPIHVKLSCIKACRSLGLPTGICRNGAKKRETIILPLAGHNQFRIDISRSNNMLSWQKSFGIQSGLNRFRDGSIIGGCYGCLNMGNQMRCFIITGFGQMGGYFPPTEYRA